ncbi:preprotein translocase subunit YajC [Marinobacter sp. R17]|uniref:preprotein translocase subunit YajC n=1 Tax=Marinobacter TaxID=2742 RepID=UPI000F4C0EF6|nr:MULTISPECIES: preprotein translocase subunit YajC [Marinobacter]ROU01554.1 preprotein translocase subunit YajC [Marinobacter sp. R17]
MKALRNALSVCLAASPAAAMAQQAGGAGQGGMGVIGQVIFFAGFILIFYLLIWRPQSKRAKEHKNLMAGLSKGDEVVTSGGMAGRITKVTDDFIVIEVADNVEVKVQKVAVATALPKGTLKDI